jgi:transposase
MGPYSMDLRSRVMAAYRAGVGTVRELAELFGINKDTVCNWRRLERETGGVGPRPHGGGVPPTIRDDALDALCRLVGERDDATIVQLQKALEQECGIRTSHAAVSRALQRADFSRKRRHSTRKSGSAPT